MRKRILASVLMLCCTWSMLYGCSSKETDQNSGSVQEGEAAESTESASSSDQVDRVLLVDNGSEFSICEMDGSLIKESSDRYLGFPSEGKFIIEQDDKIGIMDISGQIVLDPQYENDDSMEVGYSTYRYLEGAAVIKEGELYGYADDRGEIIIEPQFQFASPFFSGLASVELNGKKGYIDQTGDFVIEPIYEFAYSFSNGLAQVKLGENWGIINTKGEMVQNEKISPVGGNYKFHDGLALVEAGQYYSYINEAGELAIEGNFKEASPFENEIACVQIYTEDRGDVYGYINTQGEYIIEPRFKIANNFNEGLAFAAGDVLNEIPDGYIDMEGNCVIELKDTTDAFGFSDGLAFIHKRSGDETHPCYIDTQGNEVIDLRNLDAGNQYQQGAFKNGYAVIMSNDNHVGLIDKNGAYVFEPKYTYINADYIGSDQIVILAADDGTWGVAKLDGTWIIEPDHYEEITVIEREDEAIE